MMTATKTVIITGGNTGLGYACAQHICASNKQWHVILACRNETKAQAAVAKLKADTSNSNISFEKIELASFKSVHDFTSSFLNAAYPPLHGIICNAGISLGDKITTTADGIETAFQVNCLGHFLLVNLLLPHLKDDSRILFVSSELHRNDGPMKSFRPTYKSVKDLAYPTQPVQPIKDSGSKRYAATKLCLLFYTYELASRLGADNRSITVNAYNPGLMPDTGLGGLNKMFFTKFFLKYILPIFSKGAVSTPSKSGKFLAELLINDTYQDMNGAYFDINKNIPSSQESNDKVKWQAAWHESEEIVGLKKH